MPVDSLDDRSDARRVANIKRRLAALERHHAARGPDGKSTLAVEAGRIGGRAVADKDPGGPSAFGTRLALKRWHPDAIPAKGGDGDA